MKTIIYNPDNNAVVFEEKRFSYVCITCGKEEEILVKLPIVWDNFYLMGVKLIPNYDTGEYCNVLRKYKQGIGFICDDCLSIKDIIE